MVGFASISVNIENPISDIKWPYELENQYTDSPQIFYAYAAYYSTEHELSRVRIGVRMRTQLFKNWSKLIGIAKFVLTSFFIESTVTLKNGYLNDPSWQHKSRVF